LECFSVKYTNQSKEAILMKFWRNLKITQRIFGGLIIVLVCSLLLAAISYFSMEGIAQANQQILKVNAYRLSLINFQSISEKALINADYIKRMVDAKISLQTKDELIIENLPSQIDSPNEPIFPLIRAIVPAKSSNFKKLSDELQTNCNKWSTTKDDQTLEQITNSLNEIYLLINSLTSDFNQIILTSKTKAETQITTTRNLDLFCNLTVLALLTVIILLLLGELRVVFFPLKRSSEVTLEGASDALGYAAQINESISELKTVLQNVGEAIAEVSNGAQDSTYQVKNIVILVKTTNNLVTELAEKALAVVDTLNSNQSNLQEKIIQVQELSANVAASLAIIFKNTDTAEELSAQVKVLEEHVTGINSFLEAMTRITEQTNLLALNASIEAARAKEHGKGFGIVASRIRNLSEETNQMTYHISSTVDVIQNDTQAIFRSLTNIIAVVRDSAAEVSAITQEFSQLKEVLKSLYHSNESIINVSSLQMNNTRQIHEKTQNITVSIDNISAQTAQVSASMEELSASSQQIIGQIELINQRVSETYEVVERQVELARLAKETVAHFSN
jgi:methyl-accepting chemotaxis protein